MRKFAPALLTVATLFVSSAALAQQRSALTAEDYARAERALPELNHLFQTDPTAKSQYASIKETIAPAALQVIGD